MLRTILILLVVPALALATEGWRPCPGIPTPLSANISDCVQTPCLLKRGSSVTWESTFVAPEYSDELKSRAFFNDLTTQVTGEYPLPQSQRETCNNLIGARCPVYDDEEVTYTGQMPILYIYPPNIDLDLMMLVQNENGRNMTCFQVLARTVN